MLGGGGTGTTTRNFIGRLNPDGTLDTSFNPGANGRVNAIAVQADGKILVGGAFTMLGGGGTGTTARNFIGRLNPDGTLDTAFDPGANNTVFALAVQADSKILIGGSFAMLGGGGTGTTTRNRIGRFFQTVRSTRALIRGRTILSSLSPCKRTTGFWLAGFSPCSAAAAPAPRRATPSAGLMRTARSTLGFNPGANSSVNVLAVQPDGKILVGGAFQHARRRWHRHDCAQKIGRLESRRRT